MAGIPKQVEEAATMAEDLFAGMNPDEETAEDTQAAEEESETEETAEDQEPEEEEEETSEDDNDEEEEDFRQKYSTLQSKYDKEVPRLHKELRELKQSILERLGEKKEPDTVEPTTEAVNEKLVKFREEYGDDLYDYLKEFLKEEGKTLLGSQMKPVEEKLDKVEEAQVVSARKAFNEVLDQQVKGNWREPWENEDPAFLEFLQQPGPMGLMTYGEMMTMANQSWNAEAMAEIFNTFLGATEAPTPGKKASTKQRDAAIAPSRSTRATSPKADEKTTWTQESIKQFEIDDRRGKYSSEESQALWNDLLAAAAEGRITS